MAGQKWDRSKRRIKIATPKVIALSTNVICPNRQMGRVVNYQHGLNVVINAKGAIIGCFATSDLRLYK